MNRIIRLSGLSLALSSAFLCVSCHSGSSSTSPSPSADGGPINILCYSSPTAQVVRLSAVFPIKTHDPTTMVEEPWSADFRRYLGQSGNEGGISVTCDQVTSVNAEQEKADALRKQGHTVVETGWKYAN
jgi:hypothetical protein